MSLYSEAKHGFKGNCKGNLSLISGPLFYSPKRGSPWAFWLLASLWNEELQRRYYGRIGRYTAGILASENTSLTASSMPRHLSPTMSFTLSGPRLYSHWKKLTQLALSSPHDLGSAKNRTVSGLIDRYCNQNGYPFKLTTFTKTYQHLPLCRGRFCKSSLWTYAFFFSPLMVGGETLLLHRASVMSSTRQTKRFPNTSRWELLPRSSHGGGTVQWWWL